MPYIDEGEKMGRVWYLLVIPRTLSSRRLATCEVSPNLVGKRGNDFHTLAGTATEGTIDDLTRGRSQCVLTCTLSSSTVYTAVRYPYTLSGAENQGRIYRLWAQYGGEPRVMHFLLINHECLMFGTAVHGTAVYGTAVHDTPVSAGSLLGWVMVVSSVAFEHTCRIGTRIKPNIPAFG